MKNKIFFICLTCIIVAGMPVPAQIAPLSQNPDHHLSETDENACGITFNPECSRQLIPKIDEMIRSRHSRVGEKRSSIRKPCWNLRSDTDRDPKPWTVLLYDCADQGVGDIFDWFSEKVNSGPNINVLVLRDTPDMTTTLYYIEADHTPTVLADLGELSMSDYTTLRDFVSYADTNYHGDRTILAVYGHGGAWMGAGGEEDPNFNMLPIDGFRQALTESNPVDILMYTAPCLMGNLEAAYQLKDLTDVTIGSPESSNYLVWHDVMDDIRNILNDTPAVDIYSLSESIIQLTFENNLGSGNYEEYFTESAIRSDRLDALGTAMASLSSNMRNNLPGCYENIYAARELTEMYGIIDEEFWQLGDLYDFAEEYSQLETNPDIVTDLAAVLQALDEAVIAEWHGIEQDGGHGLTIYFPQVGSAYIDAYETSNLGFLTDTGWDLFLQEYRQSAPATATPTWPPATPTPGPDLPLDRSPDWFGPVLNSTMYDIVDMNGDELPDLITITEDETGIEIYWNSGGSFNSEPGWTYQRTDGARISTVTTGYFTGETYPDLLLFNYIWDGETNIPRPGELFRNTTGSPATTPDWYSQPHYVSDAAIGDINGDGLRDVMLGCFNEVSVAYFGSSTQILNSTPSWIGESRLTSELELADLDGDNQLELILLVFGGSLLIYDNDSGDLETTPSWQTSAGLTYYAEDFALGDPDLDGDLDIAIARIWETNLLLENIAGVVSTTPSWESLSESDSHSVDWADVDGDGFPELVFGNYSYYWSGSPVLGEQEDIIYGNVSGNLTQTPVWISNTLELTAFTRFSDLDNDADPDLFVGTIDSELHIFRNQSICNRMGITLNMPRQTFCSGDIFCLNATLCNPLIPLDNARVFVLLEAFGQFWSLPGWIPLESGIDNFTIDLPHGPSEMEIIPAFTWPGNCGQGMGLRFMAAILQPATSEMLGDLDVCYFGYY